MKHTYTVTDQKTGHLAALNLWQHHIKRHTADGGVGRLTWEPLEQKHRHQLRKMFHGPVLAAFVEHTGHSHKEMKAWLTWRFCPDQIDAAGHLVPDTDKSTEAMADDQFLQFLTEVQAFGAAELGLIFPEQP